MQGVVDVGCADVGCRCGGCGRCRGRTGRALHSLPPPGATDTNPAGQGETVYPPVNTHAGHRLRN